MRRVIFIGLFSFAILSAFGQNTTDSIEIKKAMGTTFRQDGKNLKPKQLPEIMQSNPGAYKEMRSAKSNYDAATVFGIISGALVGWPIGTALGAAIRIGLWRASAPVCLSYPFPFPQPIPNAQKTQSGYTTAD